MLNQVLFTIAALQAGAFAQGCPSLTPTHKAPEVAEGYEARLIAQGLEKPRGIIFDNKGNLLVVERGRGVSAFTVEGSGSCVSLKDKKTVIGDGTLNHGIEVSDDGKTLYASSMESVFKYKYDSNARTVNGQGELIVTGMWTDDTVTRTVVLSRKSGNKLLVSRGSDENIDLSTVDQNGGQSQIRIFDANKAGQDYSTGTTLGWGLRNAVGITENPVTGDIWSTENGVDNIMRDGFEIHENNPAEELNFHGKLDDAKNPLLGKNFGYPLCHAVWNTTEIPSAGRLQTGQQFAIADSNATSQDAFCNEDRQAPRLVFQPHTAPLDMKFDSKAENMYVALHGSWNREDPVGYSVSVIKFGRDGQPVEPQASINALTPIVHNGDTSECPGQCFRPVGLAWDRNGRLYMTSDATGEIYVIVKAGGKPLDEARPAANMAARVGANGAWVAAVVAIVLGFL